MKEDFVSVDEESFLLENIQWDLDSSTSAELKHRRVKHFGFAFSYEGNNVDKQNPLPNKIPKEMEFLLQRFVISGLVTDKYIPDQLTCNQYNPG